MSDEANAAALWKGLETPKAEWVMNKADFYTFMRDGVAATISGDEAKASSPEKIN